MPITASPVPVVSGGTGAASPDDARKNLGVGTFATRGELITWWANNSVDDGAILSAGGVDYMAESTATTISDLPGLLPFLTIDARHFGTIGQSNMVDDTAAIQKAINYAQNIGGGIANIPTGTFLIDGNKGDSGVYNPNLGGGLRLLSNVTLKGQGRGTTILKNDAEDWRMVIGIRGAENTRICDLTIDGNWPLRAANSTDPKRGEGIIAWNDFQPLKNATIERLQISNVGHYGIGLQNVPHEGVTVCDIVLENIGGDGIDIKSYTEILSHPTAPDKATTVKNIWVKSFQQNEEHDDQAGIDIRGIVEVSDIRVDDTWGLKTGQNAKTGIRFNAAVTSNDRLGADKSTITGFYVGSTKPDSSGNVVDEFITGFEISAESVSVAHGTVENQYYGFRVSPSGDSLPIGVMLSGVNAINCKGTSSDGRGFDFGADADHCSLNGFAKECDIGFDTGGTYNRFSGSAKSCLVGLVYRSTVTSNQQKILFEACTTDIQDKDSFFDQSGNILNETAAILGPRKVFMDFAATADDTSWTGEDAKLGGLRWWKRDASGGNAGLWGELALRATGSSGGNFSAWLSILDAGVAMKDVVEWQDSRARYKVPVETPVYTVSSLPSAVSSGARAFVSDSNSTTFSSVVAGLGNNTVPVFYDGSNWRIG